MAASELREGGTPETQAAAFLRLAEHQLDPSYRLARAILHDSSEAEDATHDALVQAWRKWSTLRDPSLFEHWFTRILINTCRNRLRHASAHRSAPLSELLSMPRREDPFATADDRDALGQALRQLSPDHRVVVALRFFRDLSTDEIARLLGVRAGTVRSRLHYALKQLQKEVQR
jgi:RNA polymerase sigma-70 factor (ECF subfamily)